MIHAVTIIENLEVLHLAKGDVILVDLGAHDPVMLYRPLPVNYAAILPTLIEQHVATSSLTVSELASLASLSEPPANTALPAPRHQEGRNLRLVRD